MDTISDSLFFVLREGATQEEQWSWEDLEDMCRTGELSGRARIFLPGKNEWVCIAESDLAGNLTEDRGEPDLPEGEGAENPLESDYRTVLSRLSDSPESLDALIEAGALAHDLEDMEASRRHFQTALNLHPFNGRAAQEIRRRFSRHECREFRLLTRPAQAWDDLAETGAFAFTRGAIHAAVPAAVLSAISLVPGSGPVIAMLLLWWTAVTAAGVSRGDDRVATWRAALERPWSLAILMVGSIVVVAEVGALLLGFAWLGMWLQGDTAMGVIAYSAGSPLIVVSGALLSVSYAPGVVAALAGEQPARALAPWLVVRDIIVMGQEYVVTAFAMGMLVFVCVGLFAVTSAVPVFGEIIASSAAAILAPTAGYVVGRLCARFAHKLPA